MVGLLSNRFDKRSLENGFMSKKKLAISNKLAYSKEGGSKKRNGRMNPINLIY